jgi:hypothetical protein
MLGDAAAKVSRIAAVALQNNARGFLSSGVLRRHRLFARVGAAASQTALSPDLFLKVSNIDHDSGDPESMLASSPTPYRHLPVTESVALPPDPRRSSMIRPPQLAGLACFDPHGLGSTMRFLIIAACLAVTGCASPLPVDREQYSNLFRKDLEDQLGITRAKQTRDLCSKLPAPAIGMSGSQVLASCWGNPARVVESITAQRKIAVWGYPEGRVLLDNGIVRKIETER